jgi:hypothetical protein
MFFGVSLDRIEFVFYFFFVLIEILSNLFSFFLLVTLHDFDKLFEIFKVKIFLIFYYLRFNQNLFAKFTLFFKIILKFQFE